MSTTMNHLISEKINRISGACSTFLPGIDGSVGNRGPMTFLGSSDYTDPDHYLGTKNIQFTLPVEPYSFCSIRNTYGYTDPLPFDYIIYAMEHHTYLMYIVSVDSTDQYKWNVTTELIDQWDTGIEDPDDPEIIDVTIGVIDRMITIKYMTRGIAPNFILDPDNLHITGNADNIETGSLKYGFRFNVTSRTAQTLGHFRVQLEFNTNLQSPAMDTIIAEKFIDPSTMINRNLSAEGQPEIPLDQYNMEKLTFRGYIGNYSCSAKQGGGTYNFDNEKLDNFTVIIKDFDEGTKDRNFSKDICIPKSVLKDARSLGHPYTCKIYGYVNTHDKIYHKIYIGDLTSDLYSIIDGMSTDNQNHPIVE